MSKGLAQTYMIFIQAPASKIWAALTQPEHTEKYFNGHVVQVELRPGGSFNYPASRSNATLVAAGEVVEFDEPKRLVHTWQGRWSPEVAKEAPGRLTWTIEEDPNDGVSKLTLVHDQLERSPITARQVSGAGWSRILSSLKTYLETGAGLGAK